MDEENQSHVNENGYHTSQFEAAKSKSMKKISVQNIVNSIPRFLSENTHIIIDVFASQYYSLNPCEKVSVKTGLKFELFLPITHHLKFEGFENSFGLVSVSKIVWLMGEEELMITVKNYSDTTRVIRENMPLGKIVISPNP